MNGIHALAVTAAFIPLLSFAAENPQGDAAAGKKLADKICAACHGMDGNAIIPQYPDLAGQNASYIIYALETYKKNQRMGANAAVMTAQAKGLSAQDMANAAAYYSSLGE